jgi:hypothetical protein
MIVVKKADGSNIFWDGADLRKRIEFARIGLDLCLSNDEIEAELRRSVYDQIGEKDLDATIILNSKTLIERDADFARFAGRIQLTYLYEEVLGWDMSATASARSRRRTSGPSQVPRARRRNSAPEPAPARVQPRAPGGRPRSVVRPRVRLPRHPDPL